MNNQSLNKYDEAIEFLTENPVSVYSAWLVPMSDRNKGGCLFKFITPNGEASYPDLEGYGIIYTAACLTLIRSPELFHGGKVPAVIDMTGEYNIRISKVIAEDERIPKKASDIIIPEGLYIFKHYQEAFDDYYNHKITEDELLERVKREV